MIVALIVTAVAALANWFSRWRPNDRLELISKPATTIGAIVVAATAGGPHTATIVAVIALGLCMIGDVALLPAVDRFVVGLAAFVLLEKTIPAGDLLSRIAGALLIAWGGELMLVVVP